MSTGLLRAPAAHAGTHDVDPRGGPTPHEAVFEVLSNGRRQQIVHSLLQRDAAEVTMRDLSRQLAAWENDIEPGAVTLAQRKRGRGRQLPAWRPGGFEAGTPRVWNPLRER